MRILIIVIVILVSCNHRRSNVKDSRTNLFRLTKLEKDDWNSQNKFDSLVLDSVIEGKPFKRKFWYDSSKTLRFITERLWKDTGEVFNAHFIHDSLFLLDYHVYDTSGIFDAVTYCFENGLVDTLGNKELLSDASKHIERLRFFYNKYKKLN